MQTPSLPDLAPPPAPSAPAVPSSAVPPSAPWAWVAAVVLGQPTADRVVRAFFWGLIGLVSVLLGAARGCR